MHCGWELEYYYEVKQNTVRANSIKKGSLYLQAIEVFDNMLSNLTEIHIDTKSMDSYTESALKDILTPSSDTLKDTFFHLGGNISDLTNLTNNTSEV